LMRPLQLAFRASGGTSELIQMLIALASIA
jgi:hypothetical protein